ncbi:MAG TPA: MFS transporter, partial [Candidatus Limnocylindrales bacterium]|nr:MFS transporter [Candidatus Limnocylindrales bacterium]
QIATGTLSDRLGRRPLVAAGMLLQAVALAGIALAGDVPGWAAAAVGLGVGTALVYPTLLAAVGDAVAPAERSTALGVYRFWRDTGTLAGAVGGGLLADVLGLRPAILLVALATGVSGVVAWRSLVGRPVAAP